MPARFADDRDSDNDESGKNSSAPKTREVIRDYIDGCEDIVQKVDAIEDTLSKMRIVLANREWIVMQNASELQSVGCDADVDMESLNMAHSQMLRFKRFVSSTYRRVAALKTSFDEFGDDDSKDESNG